MEEIEKYMLATRAENERIGYIEIKQECSSADALEMRCKELVPSFRLTFVPQRDGAYAFWRWDAEIGNDRYNSCVEVSLLDEKEEMRKLLLLQAHESLAVICKVLPHPATVCAS